VWSQDTHWGSQRGFFLNRLEWGELMSN
jgi:hypothetical protein